MGTERITAVADAGPLIHRRVCMAGMIWQRVFVFPPCFPAHPRPPTFPADESAGYWRVSHTGQTRTVAVMQFA